MSENDAAATLGVEQEPSDQSGRRSRGGYQYQDLCSLRYCIRIAQEGTWDEVWCESHEDIVLIRNDGGIERFRFVQVKFQYSADRHWSCKQLCASPSRGGVAESVLGKLFGKGALAASCDFRLATNEGVDSHLRTFAYRWNANEPTVDIHCPAAAELLRHLGKWTPHAGRSREFYIQRFGIELHAADLEDMEVVVSSELSRLLLRHNVPLLPDELEIVFRYLYGEVFTAATRPLGGRDNPERIDAVRFRDVAVSRARAVANRTIEVSDTPPREVLHEQLSQLGIPLASIETAANLRRHFYSTWRRAGTEQSQALESALRDIEAICAEESIRRVEDSSRKGVQTLGTVLERVRLHHAASKWSEQGVTLALMQGMLFFLISRNGLELH